MTTETSEIEALEKSIAEGDLAILLAQEVLDNIYRKQSARRQELGYQKSRLGMKLSRVSEKPVDGSKMIVVQTDCGISTRWLKPN